MMPGEIILEGDVERVTYESAESAFRVIKIAVEGRKAHVTVVGSFAPVAVGARIRVSGTVVHDKRHGEQLRAASVTELAPATLAGIEKYLGSGMIKGVGGAFAKRIVQAFGFDTLRVLDEEPERLHEVVGLGARRIDSVVAAWRDQRAVREVMVFLQTHGASPALAARIFKRYGPGAVAIVARDPYRLSLDVWGVGFKTADKIAASLGIAKDAPERMRAGVLHCMQTIIESGHVFVVESELLLAAANLLGFAADDALVAMRLADAVARLADASHIAVEDVANGERRVFTRAMHEAEVRLAARIKAFGARETSALSGAAEAIAAFEQRSGVALAPEQRDAVAKAARSRMLVITGGPGVGKTTIVRAVLSVFDGAGLDVRLAAPTGRAAKRMTEATGRESMTLHRLLEFDPKTAHFRRGKGNPIAASAIVIDEASMIDLPMADALASAVADDARLVLVGDVDQLPSVGPGAVLRDLIASGAVPCARLTQIFRQAKESLIVTNAHRINVGEAPVSADAENTNADFFVIDRRDPDSARKTILELVTSRIPKRFGLNPVTDIQVLTPMHRGSAGSIALNEALQASLNPSGDGVTRGDRTLRVGDKVMQLKNDYERSIWNGDVGIVTRIDVEEETLFVGFDAKPSGGYDREVAYDGANLDELTLAYACSIHKSQGSEYPAVVIPLLTAHFVMLTKNLLYTAVTRGKRLVVLVADPRALTLALAQDRNDERRTRLAARLAAEACLTR
jgi:exodeoxyribonuclease V alpha subunit